MKEFKEKLHGIKNIVIDYVHLEIKNPLPKMAPEEKAAVELFRKEVQKTPRVYPSPTWRFFSFRLRMYVRFFDPGNFLNWTVICGTMFQKSIPDVYLKEMTSSKDWETQWKPAVKENVFGNPEISKQVPGSSGNLLTHAFHLFRLQKITGISFANLGEVVEFGGGYGSMCRLLRNLGFKGTYVLFDLPIFLCLQKLYLNAIGQPTEYLAAENESAKNILVSTTKELASVTAGTDGKKRLFIATWSISETPIAARNEIFALVKNFNYFIIGYQKEFDGMDNNAYFKNLADAHPDVEWTIQDIAEWSSRYLIGKRK